MQVVSRALAVLKAVASGPDGRTASQIAKDLKLPLASVHRLLTTLAAERYVVRVPETKQFFLGPAARSFVKLATAPNVLVPPPAAVIEASRRSNETVFLTELISGSAVCVALAESTRPLRLFVQVGESLPFHAAASARVLLAYQPEVVARHLLRASAMDHFTPMTLDSEDAVLSRLKTIRQLGYDTCDSELDPAVWAASAPVFESAGRVRWSVTLAAAKAGMTEPDSMYHGICMVREAAGQLSRSLGYVPGDGPGGAQGNAPDAVAVPQPAAAQGPPKTD
jgi:IclR family acetate operon transcriptional repressor